MAIGYIAKQNVGCEECGPSKGSYPVIFGLAGATVGLFIGLAVSTVTEAQPSQPALHLAGARGPRREAHASADMHFTLVRQNGKQEVLGIDSR